MEQSVFAAPMLGDNSVQAAPEFVLDDCIAGCWRNSAPTVKGINSKLPPIEYAVDPSFLKNQ